MTVCAYCAEITTGSDGLCPYHGSGSGYGFDWARGNRIICDFIHRGIVRAMPRSPRSATDMPEAA
jgi:hypothetical protein